VNTIKAVYEHAPLLRASFASAGNDLRLGVDEAPPAIISTFIGSQLTSVLDELEKSGNVKVRKGDNMYMKLGIDKIPEIILDNTDTNRTSPFAFTGHKFELRAVGGESNVAQPMTVLNLIVADQLWQFSREVDAEIRKGVEKRMAIVNILRKYIKSSEALRFEGDCYSKEWLKEASRRGLPHIKDTPRALDAFVTEKTKKLYTRHKVCTERELEARREILLDNYILKIQIESRVIGDLALNHVIPTAIAYQNKLIQNAEGLKKLGIDNSTMVDTIENISTHIDQIKRSVNDMVEERKRINRIEDTRNRAVAYCDEVKEKYFDKIRYAVDKLEMLVDDEDWPLVKYRELLFLR